MAYFTCGSRSCRFTFVRTEEPDSCPDCGKSFIRDATEEEIAEYKENHRKPSDLESDH